VDRRGVTASIEVPMSEQEIAGMAASAESVRAVHHKLGL
jgi:L-lactate dehydrogenase